MQFLPELGAVVLMQYRWCTGKRVREVHQTWPRGFAPGVSSL